MRMLLWLRPTCDNYSCTLTSATTMNFQQRFHCTYCLVIPGAIICRNRRSSRSPVSRDLQPETELEVSTDPVGVQELTYASPVQQTATSISRSPSLTIQRASMKTSKRKQRYQSDNAMPDDDYSRQRRYLPPLHNVVLLLDVLGRYLPTSRSMW